MFIIQPTLCVPGKDVILAGEEIVLASSCASGSTLLSPRSSLSPMHWQFPSLAFALNDKHTSLVSFYNSEETCLAEKDILSQLERLGDLLFTVSQDQRSWNSLAGWFLLRAFHEAGTAVSEGLAGVGGSASKRGPSYGCCQETLVPHHVAFARASPNMVTDLPQSKQVSR